MIEQQTWIITFNGNADDVTYQIDILNEFLLNASADITIDQKSGREYTQGWVGGLILKLKGASSTIKKVNGAISTFFQSTHSASINIEIKDGQLTKVEMKNITSKDCDKTLNDILSYLESH